MKKVFSSKEFWPNFFEQLSDVELNYLFDELQKRRFSMNLVDNQPEPDEQSQQKTFTNLDSQKLKQFLYPKYIYKKKKSST